MIMIKIIKKKTNKIMILFLLLNISNYCQKVKKYIKLINYINKKNIKLYIK